MVLERLPGVDLLAAHADLTPCQLRVLAGDIVTQQAKVARLPLGRAFGYAPAPAGPFPYTAWADVIAANLARSAARFPRPRTSSASLAGAS